MVIFWTRLVKKTSFLHVEVDKQIDQEAFLGGGWFTKLINIYNNELFLPKVVTKTTKTNKLLTQTLLILHGIPLQITFHMQTTIPYPTWHVMFTITVSSILQRVQNSFLNICIILQDTFSRCYPSYIDYFTDHHIYTFLEVIQPSIFLLLWTWSFRHKTLEPNWSE